MPLTSPGDRRLQRAVRHVRLQRCVYEFALPVATSSLRRPFLGRDVKVRTLARPADSEAAARGARSTNRVHGVVGSRDNRRRTPLLKRLGPFVADSPTVAEPRDSLSGRIPEQNYPTDPTVATLQVFTEGAAFVPCADATIEERTTSASRASCSASRMRPHDNQMSQTHSISTRMVVFA